MSWPMEQNVAPTRPMSRWHCRATIAGNAFPQSERLLLETHACRAARLSSRSVSILRELADLLSRERVVLPRYTILPNSVRAALMCERKRLDRCARRADRGRVRPR